MSLKLPNIKATKESVEQKPSQRQSSQEEQLLPQLSHAKQNEPKGKMKDFKQNNNFDDHISVEKKSRAKEPDEDDYGQDEFEEDPQEDNQNEAYDEFAHRNKPPLPSESQILGNAKHEIVEPLETVISLKTPLQGHLTTTINPKNVEPSKENVQKPSLSHLKNMYQQKLAMAQDLKISLNKKKKELKQIGDQVDKDLNKSLIKVVVHKPSNRSVNIRGIFSAPTNGKSEELKEVRSSIRKMKEEVEQINLRLNDPITSYNQERGLELKNKVRQCEVECAKFQQEKRFLHEEVSRAGENLNIEEGQLREEELKNLKETLNGIISEQNQEKSKLYRLEKDDILCMEKTKFLQEKNNYLQSKKSRSATIDVNVIAKLDQEIKELVQDINEKIEERNRTEIEKRSLLKSLTLQVQGLQTKNLQIYTKLREYEAFLLHYYDRKSRRSGKEAQKGKDSKLQQKSSVSSAIDHTPKTDKVQGKALGTATMRTANDKNIMSKSTKEQSKEEVVMVEKKKSYEFGVLEIDNPLREVFLSDDFLGSKNILARIKIWADEENLYSIGAEYVNQKADDQPLKGYVIGSRREMFAHTQAKSIVLDLKCTERETISYIHVGFGINDKIKYLNLTTSEGSDLTWGNNDGLLKSEQKNIRKYQFAYLKGKCSLFEENEKKYFCLTAIGLSTVYLGTK